MVKKWMRNRSVVEIMVIVFTFVTAIVILSSAALIFILEIQDADNDTSLTQRGLITILSLILGALLGLLAGRNAVVNRDLSERPDGGLDDLGEGPEDDPSAPE